MTADAILKAAAPFLAELGRQLDALAADVRELREIEETRMRQVYLASWDHAGVPRNGHGRKELQ